MTDDDRPTFAHAMTFLAETLNEPMSLGRIEGYFRALSDLPIDTVRAGIDEAMATCAEFFPKPGKIRLAVPKREYVLNPGMYTPIPPARPALASPVDIGALVSAAVENISLAVDAHRESERTRAQSDDEIKARKAALREQAKKLLLDDPEGSS